MRPDSSVVPPRKHARLSPREARESEMLIAICGDMFAAGFDTRDMSKRLFISEAAATAALHVARERQRHF